MQNILSYKVWKDLIIGGIAVLILCPVPAWTQDLPEKQTYIFIPEKQRTLPSEQENIQGFRGYFGIFTMLTIAS